MRCLTARPLPRFSGISFSVRRIFYDRCRTEPQDFLQTTFVSWTPWLLVVLLLTFVTIKSHAGPAGALACYILAFWYGPKFHGKTMANGQRFNMHALTVAHKILPLGAGLILGDLM
jgi:hypothetical protein